MLGIANGELALAYVLCILASVLCVVYGLLKWNDAGPLADDPRGGSRKSPGSGGQA